jgi:hypothetical protein
VLLQRLLSVRTRVYGSLTLPTVLCCAVLCRAGLSAEEVRAIQYSDPMSVPSLQERNAPKAGDIYAKLRADAIEPFMKGLIAGEKAAVLKENLRELRNHYQL